MDCESANSLMMKYMDGDLSEHEAARLNHHITECAACKEEFMLYDSIVKDFSALTLVKAPDDLESRVMSSIYALPAYTGQTVSHIMYGFWGLIAVIMSLGALLVMNRDYILEQMALNPSFAPILIFLNPLAASVKTLFAQTQMLVQQAGAVVEPGLNWVVPIAVCSLAVAQFIIYHNEKQRKEKVAE
ncbi:MAG: zf-HC2 domain-containing protein [Clostridiales bacterium]|jgi:hypothetical protein|nr:zf-HC2 domain-containing protein [Clostridiales bacterium]